MKGNTLKINTENKMIIYKESNNEKALTVDKYIYRNKITTIQVPPPSTSLNRYGHQ
ncbi:MAG: hypothetical protein ABI045_02095 [Flavobacteriales bacterium]